MQAVVSMLSLVSLFPLVKHIVIHTLIVGVNQMVYQLLPTVYQRYTNGIPNKFVGSQQTGII